MHSDTNIVTRMSGPTLGNSEGGEVFGKQVPWSDFSAKYIAANHALVLLILVIVVIYLLYRMFWAAAESFNPTATMRAVSQEQAYVASPFSDLTAKAIMGVARGPAYESMEGGKGAEQGQGKGVAAIGSLQGVPMVSAATDPSSPLMPGSASWQVLNSPAFNCGGRDLNASSNAWAWQNRVATGEAMSARPNESELTKVMAGL